MTAIGIAPIAQEKSKFRPLAKFLARNHDKFLPAFCLLSGVEGNEG